MVWESQSAVAQPVVFVSLESEKFPRVQTGQTQSKIVFETKLNHNWKMDFRSLQVEQSRGHIVFYN
jgi:hypothetical protein